MTVHHGWATFYGRGDSNPRLADGGWYEDRGDMCAAPRGVPLGTILVVRWHGRMVRVKVRDRSVRTVDLTPHGFRLLVGTHWRELGRVRVTYVEEIKAAPKGVGRKGRRAKHKLHRKA